MSRRKEKSHPQHQDENATQLNSNHGAPDSTSSEVTHDQQVKLKQQQEEAEEEESKDLEKQAEDEDDALLKTEDERRKDPDGKEDNDSSSTEKEDFEGALVLDSSIHLDMDKSLLIDQVEDDSSGSSEEPILASNDSSLVKTQATCQPTLISPNVVVEPSNQEDTGLILPGLSSVFSGEEAAVVVKEQRVAEEDISFTPRDSSSPKAGEVEAGGILLEAHHHMMSEDNGEEEQLPLSAREFAYILDAPTACKFRKNEDPLTYINKDLFYGLSLEFRRSPESPIRHGSTVTSIILMDFREQESREEALKTWSFWHARQHNEAIRILDVEYNVVSGIVGQPNELAYNAVSVQWSPDLGNAYIMVAVRCLSTDFSIQKGIKGIPLQLQIDTSDEFGTLVSRSICQVKVFCDKGAERKTREDLKRFVREIEKNSGPTEYCREGLPRSIFKPTSELSSKPVLFTPYSQRFAANAGAVVLPVVNPPPEASADFTPAADTPKRRCIRYREGGPDPSRIMIYVRQDSDNIFTALHVHPPSVFGLIQAISSKYQIDYNNIRHLYRRDLRGIIVKVDDDMLKFYCDEDAFLMKVLAFEEKNTQSMVHDIVLVDLKTSLPDIRGGLDPGALSSFDKDSNNNNSEHVNESAPV